MKPLLPCDRCGSIFAAMPRDRLTKTVAELFRVPPALFGLWRARLVFLTRPWCASSPAIGLQRRPSPLPWLKR